MGSLTAAAPLSLGPSIGQQSNAQGGFTNIIPCTQNMPGTGGAGGWTDTGTNTTQPCEPWSGVFYPRCIIPSAVSDYYVSPAFSTPVLGFSGAMSLSFQISGDSQLSPLNGQTISALSRFQINWTGGAGRVDYVEINPVSGIIIGNQNITAVIVDSFYGTVAFSQVNKRVLVHEVQFTITALPAGITGATARFYPSLVTATGRAAFGAAQCVSGSVVPEYTPSQVVGGGLNSSLLGQPVRGTVAPRYPRVLLADNYTVDQALDSGLELVQTVAGKTISFSSSVAAAYTPYNVLGCDVKIVNASGGALTIQGNAVGVFKAPGLAAAGVTSFSMPSGATYPNNSITLTGDLQSGSTTVYDWYITASSVGSFNSSGVPVFTGGAITGTTITATTGFVAGVQGSASGSLTVYNSASINNYLVFGGTASQMVSGNQNSLGTTWQVITDTTGSGGPGAFRLGSTGYFAFNSTAGLGSGAIDLYLTRYAAKQLMISGDGTGATTNAGLILGYSGSTGIGDAGHIWGTTTAPTTTNFALAINAGNTFINATSQVVIQSSGITKFAQLSTNGRGPDITAGTATTDVQAISATQTWNNAGVTFTAFKQNVTDTASNAASLLMDLQVGGVSQLSISKAGLLKGTGNSTILMGTDVTITNPNSTRPVNLDGYVNVSGAIGIGQAVGTTANTSDTGLVRISAGLIGVGTGAAGSFSGGLKLTNLTVNRAATFLSTSVALTNGAGASAGTITNAPAVGNPTKWIGIDDNGTVRYIPAW